MFLFYKLPSAYFSGLKVKELNKERAAVTVPYKWFSKNPFNSTYFACLAMAAEMSTGLLAMMHIYKRKPAISMLITKWKLIILRKLLAKLFFCVRRESEFRIIIEETIVTG